MLDVVIAVLVVPLSSCGCRRRLGLQVEKASMIAVMSAILRRLLRRIKRAIIVRMEISTTGTTANASKEWFQHIAIFSNFGYYPAQSGPPPCEGLKFGEPHVATPV